IQEKSGSVLDEAETSPARPRGTDRFLRRGREVADAQNEAAPAQREPAGHESGDDERARLRRGAFRRRLQQRRLGRRRGVVDCVHGDLLSDENASGEEYATPRGFRAIQSNVKFGEAPDPGGPGVYYFRGGWLFPVRCFGSPAGRRDA